MKQLTDQQKKYLWIAAAVLVFIHFLPRFINMFHPSAGHAATAKQSAAHYAPAPPPPTPPPAPEILAANKYGGMWAGDTLQPDGDRCAVHLEIRLNDDLPKKLKGYSSIRCMPLQILVRGPISRGQANETVSDYAQPATAVMTATPQGSGLTFTIDQPASPASNGCTITGFSFVDFGQGQVMADWQEGTCKPGRMLLRKAKG